MACRRHARGSSPRPEAAGFQAQASNHEGDSLGGSLESFTAPIPSDGAEAEPRRAIRESECSVDAAEQNIWHVAMSKYGVTVPAASSGALKMVQPNVGSTKGVVGVSVLNPVMKSVAYLTLATRSNMGIFESSCWRSVLDCGSKIG